MIFEKIDNFLINRFGLTILNTDPSIRLISEGVSSIYFLGWFLDYFISNILPTKSKKKYSKFIWRWFKWFRVLVPSKNYTDMVEFLHTSLQLTNIIRKIKDDMYEMWCFVFEKARIEISHECDEYHMVSWYLMVSCRRTHQNQRFSYTSRVFFGFRDTHTLIFYRGIIYKRRNE